MGKRPCNVQISDWHSKFVEARKIQDSAVGGQDSNKCVRVSEEMIHVEFLPRDVAVNAHYYRTCFAMICTKPFGRNDLENCQRKSSYCKKTFIHVMANLTKAAGATVAWEIMNHPPYSPDLDPSDLHLFGPMKVHV